jgi:AcrR family transcriptional regulator
MGCSHALGERQTSADRERRPVVSGPSPATPDGAPSLRLVHDADGLERDADGGGGTPGSLGGTGGTRGAADGDDRHGLARRGDDGDPAGAAKADDAPLSRQERKQRTRKALLDAALGQLESRSFGAISLREVTRAAGITPTAFYRHFESMEELGLVLVDESFASLREMMRASRAQVQEPGDDIRASAATLVRHVGTHHPHYRFIARERSGGVASLRAAIAREIDSFSRELVQDLRRYPVLGEMDAAGLDMVASLIVTVMVATAERLLDAPAGDEATIRRRTEDQMRVIVLGALRWGRD